MKNLHSLDVKHCCSKIIRFGCKKLDQSWNRPIKYRQRLRLCKSFPMHILLYRLECLVWWMRPQTEHKDFTDSANLNFIFRCDAFEFKFDIKNCSMDLQGLDERYHSVRFRSFHSTIRNPSSIILRIPNFWILNNCNCRRLQICWVLNRTESL